MLSWKGCTRTIKLYSRLHIVLPTNQAISLRAQSKCSSNSDRLGDDNTAMKSLSQYLTTISVKNFFLLSNLIIICTSEHFRKELCLRKELSLSFIKIILLGRQQYCLWTQSWATWSRCLCVQLETWTRRPPEISSNLNYSIILITVLITTDVTFEILARVMLPKKEITFAGWKVCSLSREVWSSDLYHFLSNLV